MSKPIPPKIKRFSFKDAKEYIDLDVSGILELVRVGAFNFYYRAVNKRAYCDITITEWNYILNKASENFESELTNKIIECDKIIISKGGFIESDNNTAFIHNVKVGFLDSYELHVWCEKAEKEELKATTMDSIRFELDISGLWRVDMNAVLEQRLISGSKDETIGFNEGVFTLEPYNPFETGNEILDYALSYVWVEDTLINEDNLIVLRKDLEKLTSDEKQNYGYALDLDNLYKK